MKLKAEFEGGRQMAQTLKTLESSLSRKIQVDALSIAAEPIRDRAAALAPRSRQDKDHLADNIVIGAVGRASLDKRGRESETVVEVGPELRPNDFFYGFFQEYGTAFSGAQPFMRPAFDEEWRRSLMILSDELWYALKRKIPASQERFVG